MAYRTRIKYTAAQKADIRDLCEHIWICTFFPNGRVSDGLMVWECREMSLAIEKGWRMSAE